MECRFYFEVIAPNGLNGIEQSISEAGLDLYIYHSSFNNKNILKSKSGGIISLGMDTSTTDVMYGSGHIESEFIESKNIIEKLSGIFRVAGYSHKIGIDDENGENTIWFKHQYS